MCKRSLRIVVLLTYQCVKLMIPHKILHLYWLVTTGTLVVTTHTFLDAGITEAVSTGGHVSICQIAHAYWTAEIVRYTLDLQTEIKVMPH